jgi:hypothetical protein
MGILRIQIADIITVWIRSETEVTGLKLNSYHFLCAETSTVWSISSALGPIFTVYTKDPNDDSSKLGHMTLVARQPDHAAKSNG